MILAACEQACLRRSCFQGDLAAQARRARPVLLENSASINSAVAAECLAIRPSLTFPMVFVTRSNFLISALVYVSGPGAMRDGETAADDVLSLLPSSAEESSDEELTEIGLALDPLWGEDRVVEI